MTAYPFLGALKNQEIEEHENNAENYAFGTGRGRGRFNTRRQYEYGARQGSVSRNYSQD